MIAPLASMLPFLHIRSCIPMRPDIGTIVARYSEPDAAAFQGVLPSYDLPMAPTLPFDHGCMPSQSTAPLIPACSSWPMRSMQWFDSPVPKTETWATPKPWGTKFSMRNLPRRSAGVRASTSPSS